MNSFKKDNGWILCPSKSFPGKFYYFNVVNGDTAWSLNEAEKKFLKIPHLEKIEKPHSYPEPSSPPDNPTAKFKQPTPPTVFSQPITQPKVIPRLPQRCPSENIFTKANTSNISMIRQIPVPTFGQVTFPKSLPPIQIQVPMVVDPYTNKTAPQFLTIMMNQYEPCQLSTEKSKLNQVTYMEGDRDLFVQPCNTPLCQRFVNYKNPVINFNESNKIEKPRAEQFHWLTPNFNESNTIEKPHVEQFHSSTPKKFSMPIFPNDQSSIGSFGLSKMILTDTAKRSKFVLRESTFKLTPKSQKQSVFSQLIKNTPEKNVTHTALNFKSPSLLYQKHISTTPVVSKEPVKDKELKQNIFLMPTIENLPKTPEAKATLKRSIKVDIQKSNSEILNKKSISIDDLTENVQSPVRKDKEKSTIPQENKADNVKSSKKDLQYLDKSDLRMLLMAKKRNSMDLEKSVTLLGKKRTSNPKVPDPVTPKKKVTFNLNHLNCSDIESNEEFSTCEAENSTNKTEEDTSLLEGKLAPSATDHYLVCDTNVLLEEFEWLDSFVKLDPMYHILIPSRVMSDIVALSRRECLGRNSVTLARHLLRRLATQQPHVIVQTPDTNDSEGYISTAESIIKCCQNKIDQNARVILITNEKYLQSMAVSFKIPCYESQQIKDSTIKKPEIRFDIEKIKISVPNVLEKANIREDQLATHTVPTHTFKKKLFESTQNCTENGQDSHFDASDSKIASKPEWKSNSNDVLGKDLQNLKSKENPSLFQIQKHVTSSQVKKLPNTPQNDKNIMKSNETESLYYQNKCKEKNLTATDHKKEHELQTVSFFFQNEIQNHKTQSSSIFKLANEQRKETQMKTLFEIENNKKSTRVQPKKSLPEIDGIEKIGKSQSIFDDKFKPNRKSSIFGNYDNIEVQLQNSRLENQFFTKDIPMDTSIFKTKKYGDKNVQAHPSIFEIEKYKSTIPQQSSIFEIDEYNRSGLSANSLINNNVAIEEYLNELYEKNKCLEEKIEEKKEELICSFVQVMEDCLSNILQQSSSLLEDHSPPWTLCEALQCISQLYGSHTTVDELCSLIYGAMQSIQKKEAKNVIQIFGCGLFMIRYLKSILHPAADTDSLLDAEEHLNEILNNIGRTEVEVQPITPVLCVTDIHYDDDDENHHNRRNFVKDRSELLKYLKKHFPAWANYDDTLASASKSIQKSKEYKIVRTCGKKLGLLKISKYKNMTMNEPNKVRDQKDAIDKESKESVATQKLSNNDSNNNLGVEMEKHVENIHNLPNNTEISPKKLKFKGLKLITKANKQVDTPKDVAIKNTTLNEMFKFKPELLPNNINASKSEEKKYDLQKSTEQTNSKAEPNVVRLFGSKRNDNSVTQPNLDLNYSAHGHTFGTEETGPKVVRNIQLIPAFEEKLKSRHFDVDELDYSPISVSEDRESLTNTNYDCQSMTIDDDEPQKNMTNDKIDGQNDVVDITNDTPSKQDKYSCTNNGSYSMSLDNCVTDKATNWVQIKKEHDAANDIFLMNDKCYATDVFKENDEVYARNDAYQSFEMNDYDTNDHSNKDDTPRDSGFDSDSVNTYTFAKSFLCEINSSLKLVHEFIDGSLEGIRDTNLKAAERQYLHSKANATHERVKDIIDSLKRIIEREYTDDSFVKIIMGGAHTSEYAHIVNYKSVVKKCLVQAQMLETALMIMITITSTHNAPWQTRPHAQYY